MIHEAVAQSGILEARVVFASGREVVLEQDGEPVKARVAFSCLVQPRPGDRVLAAGGHVLGILERPGSQDLAIALPGDSVIRTVEGSLTLLSSQSITLAADQLNSVAGRSVHQAREAVVRFDAVTAQGGALQAHFDSISLLGTLFTTTVRTLIHKAHTYLRHTEAFDQVRAGQLSRKADGMYSLDSQYAVLVSAKDTKIDGERIHMG